MVSARGSQRIFPAHFSRQKCLIPNDCLSALSAFFAEGKGGFAGLIGFCGWLPLANRALLRMNQQNKNLESQFAAVQNLYSFNTRTGQEAAEFMLQLNSTPVLLEHCWNDTVVDISNATSMRMLLAFLDFKAAELRAYPEGGHWVNIPEGVDDFVMFLRNITER